MKAGMGFFFGCMAGGVAVAGGMYAAHIGGVEVRSPIQSVRQSQYQPHPSPQSTALPQPPAVISDSVMEFVRMIEVANKRRASGEIDKERYEYEAAMIAGTFIAIEEQGKYDMEFYVGMVVSAIPEEYRFDVREKCRELKK